ncbi:MAG: GerMN domain-containing protein [bacterium]|nr:GerMN domain-containing protein [bacterium]
MNGAYPGDDDGLPVGGASGSAGKARVRASMLVLALVLVVVAAGAVAWRIWSPTGRGEDLAAIAGRESAATNLPLAADRAVVLEFPRRSGDGWVVEERRLAAAGQPADDLLAVMVALCEGPRTGRAVSALPRGTRALAAFLDPARGVAVVDFSGEILYGHPGGSAAETATLGTILRTLASNFPQVTSCTILVDGRQPVTLGGHVDLSRPLSPRRWH